MSRNLKSLAWYRGISPANDVGVDAQPDETCGDELYGSANDWVTEGAKPLDDSMT